MLGLYTYTQHSALVYTATEGARGAWSIPFVRWERDVQLAMALWRQLLSLQSPFYNARLLHLENPSARMFHLISLASVILLFSCRCPPIACMPEGNVYHKYHSHCCQDRPSAEVLLYFLKTSLYKFIQ